MWLYTFVKILITPSCFAAKHVPKGGGASHVFKTRGRTIKTLAQSFSQHKIKYDNIELICVLLLTFFSQLNPPISLLLFSLYQLFRHLHTCPIVYSFFPHLLSPLPLLPQPVHRRLFLSTLSSRTISSLLPHPSCSPSPLPPLPSPCSMLSLDSAHLYCCHLLCSQVAGWHLFNAAVMSVKPSGPSRGTNTKISPPFLFFIAFQQLEKSTITAKNCNEKHVCTCLVDLSVHIQSFQARNVKVTTAWLQLNLCKYNDEQNKSER